MHTNRKGLDLPHLWDPFVRVGPAALICVGTPPSFARMLGPLIRSRPRFVFRAPYRAPLSAPHSRHVSNDAPATRKRRSNANYWKDPPRLAYSDKYPMSRELAALGARPDPLLSTSTTPRVRTQIVSPDLCGMLTPGASEMAADVSSLPLLIAPRR